MKTKYKRPDLVKPKHLEFLDDMREDGVCNMYEAPSYLQDEFNIDKKTAFAIWKYWKGTFAERHPQ